VRRLDELTEAHDFRRYETLHWALPGHEARWLTDARQGHPIMGLGPTAYGRWPTATGWRWWRAAPGQRWRDRIATGGDGRGRLHHLSPGQRAQERLIDGLRLADGFDPDAIAAETGLDRAAWLDEPALTKLLAAGRMRRIGPRLAAADLGQSDELALHLLV
jgi:coproporphyrinogen III oxidase-like Fe-S oxidoreductase